MPRPKSSDRSSDSAGAKHVPEPAPGTVRIIGGHHRGRVIRYTGDARTRPMKDRVREAVFNVLGPEVKAKHAVDLFAGTGALGFEALSRGATTATFFERHFPTADVIAENAQVLGLAERSQVIPANTLIQFRKPLPFVTPDPELAWVVFCSPPYDLYLDQSADMIRLLTIIIDRAPLGSILVVETDERFDVTLLPLAEEWRHRDYHPARIATWQKS